MSGRLAKETRDALGVLALTAVKEAAETCRALDVHVEVVVEKVRAAYDPTTPKRRREKKPAVAAA